MIDCEIMQNGGLELRLRDYRAEFAELVEKYGDETRVLCEAMESYSCNGGFTPFDAGNANPFVGLTSAPCIAESMDCDDSGKNSIRGRFWYFPNYMLESCVETLLNSGRVSFTLAATCEG